MSFHVNRRELGPLLFGVPAMLLAQAPPPGYNYDESKVGPLPASRSAYRGIRQAYHQRQNVV